jgi:DNA primase
MITKETIDRIFETVRIEEVVGDFVQLKKRGVNYIGLCPFHNEKTPSFNVSQARNIYKCFGCGKGGNAVNFVMEHEHYNYPEALRYLATKYNIEIEESAPDPKEEIIRDQKESLFVLNTFAQKTFTENLFDSEEGKSIGLSYFKERGFTEETIRTFQLGYSLNNWSAFSEVAIENGYLPEYLIKTGLSFSPQQNEENAEQIKEIKLRDRFRGRVMFPVHNLSGRIIAFGGRILKKDDKTAKYVNSPESEIYYKSKSLYGIFFAKKSIVQRDNCYLVEGYTDVISLHQCGVENVVASSGTSLTTEQIRLIARYTKNVTILYDGDAAGIKASLRGIDLILEEGLNVKIVLFPDGDDPDSYRRKHGGSALIDFIQENARDFVVFKTDLLLKEVANDPVRKAALIHDVVETIAKIPDSITRSVYIKQCSAQLDVSEQILLAEMNKAQRKYINKSAAPTEIDELITETLHPPQNSAVTHNDDEQEKYIVKLLLNYGNADLIFPEIIDAPDEPTGKKEVVTRIRVSKYIVGEISHDDIEFNNRIYHNILYTYASFYDKDEDVDLKLFHNSKDPEISALSVDLLSRKYFLSENWEQMHRIYVKEEGDNLQEDVERAILYLKQKKVLKMLEENRQKILEAQLNGLDQTELLQEHIRIEQLKVEISKNNLGHDILR